MATIGDRAATWTNPDGLVVGYGTNKPAYTGAVNESNKTASVVFDYKALNAAKAINVPVPAGTKVLDVRLVVTKGWTGGTSMTVGDGSDADGFITAAVATQAAMATAGAVINATGLYTAGATDTTAAELKAYTSADTIDLAGSGTWTAGEAALVVTYL